MQKESNQKPLKCLPQGFLPFMLCGLIRVCLLIIIIFGSIVAFLHLSKPLQVTSTPHIAAYLLTSTAKCHTPIFRSNRDICLGSCITRLQNQKHLKEFMLSESLSGFCSDNRNEVYNVNEDMSEP